MKKYNAETMQAVPNMLELVPHGVNKGSGMRKLLATLELPVEVNHTHANTLAAHTAKFDCCSCSSSLAICCSSL